MDGNISQPYGMVLGFVHWFVCLGHYVVLMETTVCSVCVLLWLITNLNVSYQKQKGKTFLYLNWFILKLRQTL